MLRRLHRDERGVAMVTAMLVSVVVFSLGLVAVELSQHNVVQSAFDRKRLQAINTAEAGIDDFLASLPTTPPAALRCTVGPVTVPIQPGAEYRVRVTYYSAFPGSVATQIPCADLAAGTIIPKGANVVSTGTAVASGAPNAVSRTMQTEIRLNVLRFGLDKAIFSNNQFDVVNNLTVNGNVGNDGDLYTNGNFTCSNSSVDYGTVEVPQGTATLSNSCTIQQDLWTSGNITMSGSARVAHDATSAAGALTMSNSSRVDNKARVATNCNPMPDCGGRVLGGVTTNSPSPGPLVIPFPTINYDAATWTAAGYTQAPGSPFTSCPAAKNFIETLNGATTRYFVRVTAACGIEFSQNTDISLGADLALIVDGSTTGGGCPTPPNPLNCAIATSNNTDFVGTPGEPKTLHLIVPKASATPCTVPGDNMLIENNTDFENVRVFLYSPCTVTLKNNNLGLGGQIYGGQVNITNHFAFTYRPVVVPGTGAPTGFNPDIAYLREITNPS
jgi:hypothetical protein